MRIVGGIFGGRRFDPPAKKWPTRPTTDFAKEALFNILINRIDFEDMVMLDLYGGTGSICYEAVSRGCNDVTYVERFAPCVSFVKSTAKKLDVEDKIDIIKSDVIKYLRQSKKTFNLIFADPPYDMQSLKSLPDLIFNSDILKVGGMLVIEHDQRNHFEDHPNFIENRKYGGCYFSFFS